MYAAAIVILNILPMITDVLRLNIVISYQSVYFMIIIITNFELPDEHESAWNDKCNKRCSWLRFEVNINQLYNRLFFTEKMIHSYAVGMAVTRSFGFEIDFVRKFISGSAACFFLSYP